MRCPGVLASAFAVTLILACAGVAFGDAPGAPSGAADAAARVPQAVPGATGMSAKDLEPSAANRARAAALAKDPAFSDEAARERAARFDAMARQTLQPEITRQQNALQAFAGQQAAAAGLVGPSGSSPTPVYRLYVSRSLDAATLKGVMALARDHQNLVVVFRGLLPGEKINQLARFLADLVHLQRTGPLPHVALDPVPFRANNVTVVPTLEKLDKNGKVIASVRGLINTDWLDAQVARGSRGDLGKLGPVAPIAEEDIVAVLRRQLAKVDLEGSARRSMETFWARQPVWPLTRAARDRVRQVDPSVTITDAITTHDGHVLAYPGQRINPMDVMPFNLAVIVIDARDPAQLQFAAGMVRHMGLTPVRVLTTAETNWQSYQDHVVALGVPLYTLRQDLVDRFQLEHVPSVVVAGRNKHLEVREYALQHSTGPNEATHAGDHRANR